MKFFTCLFVVLSIVGLSIQDDGCNLETCYKEVKNCAIIDGSEKAKNDCVNNSRSKYVVSILDNQYDYRCCGFHFIHKTWGNRLAGGVDENEKKYLGCVQYIYGYSFGKWSGLGELKKDDINGKIYSKDRCNRFSFK